MIKNEEKNSIIYLRDIGETELEAISLCKEEHNISVTTKAVKQIFEDYIKLKKENEFLKKEIHDFKEKKRESDRKLGVLKDFKNLLKILD